MAGASKESELASSLSSSVDDVEFIALLKTYASKIEDSSFPLKNVPVRKDVCCELKNRLIQSKDGKVVYETLKLLLKFTRDDSLAHSPSVFDIGILNVLQRLSHATEFESFPVNLFAWKCLSNIIYQTKDSKGLCSDKEFLKRLVNQLFYEEHRTHEEKLLLLQILYVVTAFSGQGRAFLVEECNCRQLMLDQLQTCLTSDSESSCLSEDSSSMVISTLKAFFNVMMDLRLTKIRTQQTVEEISDLLRACHKSFTIRVDDDLTRDQLHCCAGHVAYSIPIDDFKTDSFLPLIDGKCANGDHSITEVRHIQPITSLLTIMYKHLKDNTCLADVILPIVALFAQISRINSGVRKYLKQLLLPPRKNFKKRPEEGDETSHKLIQLLTNINPSIKIGVADFLFVLCKENADKFVKYTGYGNAAGLLASRGLLAGGRGEGVYSDSDTDSETEEYKAVVDEIDPVTGHIHKPRPDPTKDMSDEQKEYLAVQLANEISKLSSSSAIQPMCVSEDGKLISMHDKFHQMKEQVSEQSSDDDQ